VTGTRIVAERSNANTVKRGREGEAMKIERAQWWKERCTPGLWFYFRTSSMALLAVVWSEHSSPDIHAF
jgi:hypothetical protein